MIRNKTSKEKLIKYINEHPQERLFQAIANWSGVPYLGYADTPDGKNFRDLFHWDEDE